LKEKDSSETSVIFVRFGTYRSADEISLLIYWLDDVALNDAKESIGVFSLSAER
jgi:hypothetical protein